MGDAGTDEGALERHVQRAEVLVNGLPGDDDSDRWAMGIMLREQLPAEDSSSASHCRGRQPCGRCNSFDGHASSPTKRFASACRSTRR